MEIPDDLYRQVKAKSALEGRPVREVAVELFRGYVGLDGGKTSRDAEKRPRIEGGPAPEWFGILRRSARRVRHHDMEAIRGSIARGVATDRRL